MAHTFANHPTHVTVSFLKKNGVRYDERYIWE